MFVWDLFTVELFFWLIFYIPDSIMKQSMRMFEENGLFTKLGIGRERKIKLNLGI